MICTTATTARQMEPDVIELRWVRTPHQDRSRRTLERLLDAAEALLNERGFDNVSVAEIARAAQSSVGAFYARFRDKNGLLHHLHERFCEEAMATADASFDPARWSHADDRAILTAVVRFMAEIYRERAGMFRAFLRVAAADAAFAEREQRLVAHVLERLTGLLLRRREEIGHPQPEFAIAFGLQICASMLRDRYVLGREERGTWPDPPAGFLPELIRVYAGYLGLADAVEAAPSARVAAQ